jgi:hypothetical protein
MTIIHAWIEPGTTVISDCWGAYRHLDRWLWRHRYYQEYLYLFDNRPVCPDVIEMEMFAFLALILEMVQTGEVLEEVEQLCYPFYEQTMVHLRYHILRFLHLMDSGRNGVYRMDESHDRQWTI